MVLLPGFCTVFHVLLQSYFRHSTQYLMIPYHILWSSTMLFTVHGTQSICSTSLWPITMVQCLNNGSTMVRFGKYKTSTPDLRQWHILDCLKHDVNFFCSSGNPTHHKDICSFTHTLYYNPCYPHIRDMKHEQRRGMLHFFPSLAGAVMME